MICSSRRHFLRPYVSRSSSFEIGSTRDVSHLTREAVLAGQGGECIGVNQEVGQCSASKPDIRSGIVGLYFSGCDAGGRGVGIQQAMASGTAVRFRLDGAGDTGSFPDFRRHPSHFRKLTSVDVLREHL